MSSDDPVQNDPELSGGSGGAEIVLGLVAAFLCALLIRTLSALVPFKWRVFPIPFTAIMMLVGVAIGAMIDNGATVDYMSDGLDQFENISPSVLFAVFLPALIMPSGLNLVWHTVAQVLDKAFLLAIPGTMINATFIALISKYVFPYGWEWSQCWLFASLLSATDPVAVVNIMHASGAAPRLTTIVEGESLLNDGVAYVMFEIFLGWVLGEPVEAGKTVGFVFKACLGGPGLGLAFALGLMIWLQVLFNDAIAEISVSLVSAYGLWILCDDVLGVSGMLALVFFSVATGAVGKYHVSRSAAPSFHFFWDWVDWVANMLIFFLSGLIIAAEISKNNQEINGTDWGYTFALYALLLVARAVSIAILYPILSWGRYGVELKDTVVLSWAGLRGAVGLTLSLVVYNSENIDQKYRLLVFFHMAMMAVLTLLIQGSTTNLLLRWLGYTRLAPTKKHMMYTSAHMVERVAKESIEAQKQSKNLLGPANWEKVQHITFDDIEKALVLRGDVERKSHRLKKRPQSTDDDSHRQQTPTFNIHEKELLSDFRERLLRAVAANYSYAFSKEFLTPAEVQHLFHSVENSADDTARRLSDWKQLLIRMDYRHIPDGKRPHLKGFSALMRPLLQLLVRRESPLLGLASRNAAMAVTFCCAHAAARRQLKRFVELELGDLEEGKLVRDSGFPIQDEPSWSGSVHLPAEDDDLHPFWEQSDASTHTTPPIYKFRIHEESGDMHLHSHPSLLRRMTTSDLVVVDDVRKILHYVCEESRKEQLEAEIFLKMLGEQEPQELEDVRTEFVAISVLRKQSEMLETFLKAGMLDKKEVDFTLSIIENRMKRLHGNYQIQ